MKSFGSHPYIPNSSPASKEEMLQALGVSGVEDLYSFIPRELRMKAPMDLPDPIHSEWELKRHVDEILEKNRTCGEYLSFLGGGCYNHHVPAICDEVNSRSEFLTAYTGDTYVDHGKSQVIFEFASMMGELLDMDVVAFPTYDGGQAVCTAIKMAQRITGRNRVLIPALTGGDLQGQIALYCDDADSALIPCNDKGQIDLVALEALLTTNTACVLLQTPNYMGVLEESAREIGRMAHDQGAVFIVLADPVSLGVLEAPANYGADITCCELQPLGLHMGYGGNLGGVIATRQEPVYIMNSPLHLYGLVENHKGQFGFVRTVPDRTSYNSREKGVEFLGTNVGLWAVTVAVYLAAMGPKGMEELGESILAKTAYARRVLGEIPGVQILFADSPAFREVPIGFSGRGKTVGEINKALLIQGIFGGVNLTPSFPEWGETMLVCVTEKTSAKDVQRLANALRKILGEGENG